jgi:uncharacterized protein (TIGR03437 family)
MQKPSYPTCRLVCLSLTMLGLMTGLNLPGYSWSRRVSHQATTPPVTNPSWILTGDLNTARYDHSTTLLPNGKVLVAGGKGSATCAMPTSSAELYDPVTRTWSQTGSLNTARSGHTATLLQNGQVLVAGGYDSKGSLNSAELFDPATGVWRRTASFNTIRVSGSATLLPNGKVLAVGRSSAEAVAELYDPAAGKWSGTGAPSFAPSSGHTVLLPNGKVLGVLEGTPWDYGDLPTELYDPATGQWSTSGDLNLFWAPTVTLLQNGKVLATGLYGANNPTQAALYDANTGTWSRTGNLGTYRHYGGYTATLLADGQVLVAGGVDYISEQRVSAEELFDPISGKWTVTSPLISGRSSHTATLLQNGEVLVAGGVDARLDVCPPRRRSAELYNPTTGSGTLASVSAASFSLMGLASEAIATSFGAGLATTTIGATTLPLPTQLAGTTVKVNDSAGTERLAPLFFVSPRQVNYQIPAGTGVGVATVTVTSGDGAVSTGVALVKAVAPGLFAANADGQGVAAAVALRVKADGSQSYEVVAQLDALQNKFVARPLDLGPEGEQVYLLLFGTGIRHRSSLSTVIATIGGAYAEVSFAGEQPDFVGLDQVNVLVPRSLAGRGEVEVLLTVEAQLANSAHISVK